MTATTRRSFLQGTMAAGALGPLAAGAQPKPKYTGPNLILIRYGGGARRRESIDPKHTYSPYLAHTLAKRGVVFNNMVIDQGGRSRKLNGKVVDTSHGQGTIYIMTGSYKQLATAGGGGFDERFVPPVPTLFERFRNTYNVPEHQTLIINSEDRKQEEFLTYSATRTAHQRFGFDDRCQILSLYRFKRFLFPKLLADGKRDGRNLTAKDRRKLEQELKQLQSIDQRRKDVENQHLIQFWTDWRKHYGDSGFKNPRGDRLLTELSLRAMKTLRPRMLMVNYTDCDYVHWGIRSHYYNALGIMDQGIKQIVQAADADPFYRDNTLFVVVPDCGRDNNLLADIPFQHHFNTKSSHEIFTVLFGKGVPASRAYDKEVDQVQVASTIARLMNFPAITPEEKTKANVNGIETRTLLEGLA